MGTIQARQLDIGGDNHALVTEASLLKTGLTVGSERGLVIAKSGPRPGREILDAVWKKTQLPLVVVGTPAHYGHLSVTRCSPKPAFPSSGPVKTAGGGR